MKRARRALGLNRQRLAALATISHTTLAELEEGQQLPGAAVVARLAIALGVSASSLAFGITSPESSHSGSISERLAAARSASGLSRKAVARAAGLSDTAIRHSEEGRYLPSLEAVERLAKALDVSPGWLAFGEGEPDGSQVLTASPADH